MQYPVVTRGTGTSINWPWLLMLVVMLVSRVSDGSEKEKKEVEKMKKNDVNFSIGLNQP